jgi:hypothetical protein
VDAAAAAAAAEGATTRRSPERTRAMPHIADFRVLLVSEQMGRTQSHAPVPYINHTVALQHSVPRLAENLCEHDL